MKSNSEFLKKSKTKSVITNIIASFLIFLVFTLLLEVVLRATHLFGARISYSKPDPILGWRYTPKSKYWYYKENDHPITGRINSYGWRDKEWSLKKPENVYRIAVLGDSVVDAFQVEPDRTFLALTERQLNENHKLKVELMNFGQSGFTQTEELLVLKNHAKQFSPDMVILFFTPINDIDDINRETTTTTMRPFYLISKKEELILDTSFVKTREFKTKCFVNIFKQHSALISLLFERYNDYLENVSIEKKERAKGNKLGGYLSLCTANPRPIYLKNYQLNKMLIKAMAEFCNENRIRFMLVTIDTSAYVPEVERSFKSINPTFDVNYFEDDLRNYAAFLNIEYLGLQRIFRQAYEDSGSLLHWGHWNYQGHKIVAKALASKWNSIIVPFAE